METLIETAGCPDCGRTNVKLIENGMHKGLCEICKKRKQNAMYLGKEYIPYIKLSDEGKQRIDAMRKSHENAKRKAVKKINEIIDENLKELSEIKSTPVIENYYQVKAENNPTIAHIIQKPTMQKSLNPLSDQESFIKILKNSNEDINDESLINLIESLVAVNSFKNAYEAVLRSSHKSFKLNLQDLEEIITRTEKKLQYEWETNGFQEVDDIKFKGFLMWRKVLKNAIDFYKIMFNDGRKQ